MEFDRQKFEAKLTALVAEHTKATEDLDTMVKERMFYLANLAGKINAMEEILNEMPLPLPEDTGGVGESGN